MEEQPLGRRVAYWRNRRKMSQQLFADRLAKSKSWVDKIERGVRRLDRFSVIYEIADVLQVDAQVLLGRDPVRKPGSGICIDQVDVMEIRATLERYEKISTSLSSSANAPPLGELSKAVEHAWLTFQHSKYAVLARMLPKLLRTAQAANAAYSGGPGLQAVHLLGQVYQISSSMLRKVGEYELAWLAADRAVMMAQRSGDSLLCGLAIHRVAAALAAQGRFRPALEINLSFANQLAPGQGREATPQRLSVYGHLLLQGAMSAARLGDSATVRDLLGAADDAAMRLGRDENQYWTSFGPTNVAFHKAAAEVEMGEGGRAVQTHDLIDPAAFSAMTPERRAHHLLDLSRGLAQTGDLARAAEKLIEADRLAPSEIRCRPVAHELVSEVLRRTRGAPQPAVADLADLIGLTV